MPNKTTKIEFISNRKVAVITKGEASSEQLVDSINGAVFGMQVDGKGRRSSKITFSFLEEGIVQARPKSALREQLVSDMANALFMAKISAIYVFRNAVKGITVQAVL